MQTYERFLKYIGFETTSDGSSPTCPSTEGQRVLGQALADELKALGVKDARMDENGYVYGKIPANTEGMPAIGLIAHMDTVCVEPLKPVHARIIRDYDGSPVTLEQGTVLDPELYPGLAKFKGKDLIVTDGNSVLGADDKAGVAEIMTCAERLLADPSILHGDVCIGFTPDEEIGRGADKFDVPGFGAEYAYTVDGGPIGSIDYETFNAASCIVKINGLSIHPGSAKGRMKNAALIAMEFNGMLPAAEIPACTEGYEGFYHLGRMEGSCEEAKLLYIIRDHSMDKFEQRKRLVLKIGEFLNAKYGPGTVEVTVKDGYYNMRQVIEQHMHIVTRAEKAFRACGIEPFTVPVRGGTDGCRLSYMGLPCPNLSTGGLNAHGRTECVTVQDMEKMADVLVKLVSLSA